MLVAVFFEILLHIFIEKNGIKLLYEVSLKATEQDAAKIQ